MRKKSMRFISAALAACMMASTLPVGAFALEGDTAPESGVSTQAEGTTTEAITTIPTTGYTIEKGGDYEIKGDTYTGGITVNASDNDEVTIHIASNVKFTRDNQVFIWVENAKLVTIENTDNHTVTLNGQHFYDLSTASNGVESVINGGTYIAPGRNMIMVQGTNNTLTLNNVNIQTNTGYAVTTGPNTVYVNGGTFTKTSSRYSEFQNQGHLTLTDVTVTPQVAVDGKTSTIVENYTGAVVEINGGNYKTTNQSCIANNGTVTINNGTLESEGASCINSLGRVEINGGTLTSDAESTIYNRGSLRMSGGTVTTSNTDGVVIDASGNYGDIKLIGGTIKGIKDGIYVQDLGSSEVTLQQVTFEGSQNDIHLGEGQQINIKKTFTGKAKILVDDAKAGRRITQENDDTRYQKDLNLVSNNEGYIVGYKREDGVEYRYLADANGNAVSTQDAKATANLGAGAQQLDTTDVVPENTTVTVTADIPERAEFLEWSVVRADGEALDWTPAEDDPQTITFKMPGCNVTVAALYQNNTPDPVNPGGGDDPVTEFFEAAAVTGVAAWGLYETATGIYRVLNMRGIPMPSNRAGLATLIWEKAGQPEPQTLKTYSDVDESDVYLRKAASWMEEQGLMEARDDGSFKPYGYVTKLRTCFVWDMARDRGLVG
jgi:hypothetical protein